MSMGYKRIDGDRDVALGFHTAADMIRRAINELSAPNIPGHDVRAMECVVRAQFVLNSALGRLEDITGVPWTGIPVDPNIGTARALKTPASEDTPSTA